MKRILLIAALTLFAYSSYAQFFTLGPKVGISSSTVRVADDVQGIASGDSEVGFHAGLFTRISILGFYVQPEALFTSARGNIVLQDNISGNAESVQELTYNKIDVPVMLGFKIGPLFRVNAGPTFSFILNDDIRNGAGAAIDQIEQEYNSANVGYQVGVGLDISRLIIDLKYENNLNALGESVNIAGTSFPTDLRNQLIQLSLGFKLL